MMAPHGQQNHHHMNSNSQQQIPDTDQEPPFMMDDENCGDDEMLHMNDLRDEDMAGDDIDEAQRQNDND